MSMLNPDPNCPDCRGTGGMYIPNGPDDLDLVECFCLTRPVASTDIPHIKEPNTPTRLPSDNCPDHWNNVIIFGQCWKHEANGSLRSSFRGV